MGENSRRRRGWFLAPLLAVTLVAGACGNDDDGGDATTTTAPEAQATTTTAAPATTAAPGETTTTAAADPYEELVAAATAEGEMTIYSSQSPGQLNALAERFMEKYPGITVEVFRGVDGELSTKVEAEVQTGNVLVDMYVSASRGWVEPKAAEGWFLTPTAPNLVGMGDYDVEKYVHGTYFETNAAVLAFGWNTNDYPGGLSDFTDFLSTDLSDGKVGVIEPGAASIVDFYVWLEELYGDEFLAQLAAQEPRIYPSAVPMGEAVISGEIVAGTFVAPSVLIPQQGEGAPVEFGLSPSGAWGARYYGMILADAEQPNAAQLFADFMVTPEGQEIIAEGAGSVLPDIPGTLITNDLVRIQDIELLTEDFVADFVERWNELFR